MRRLFLALIVAAASPAAAGKLTLDQVIAKAVANPKVQMVNGDAAAAAARVDEADAARYPRVKGTAFATISPEIKCQPSAPDPSGGLCLTTQPSNFAFEFSGIFATTQVDVTQPLYTFGKISHARAAARAGLDAQNALANEAAGDAAVDAARAYWGLKVSREMGGMLDDGLEEIDKAKKDFDEKHGATIQDRQRLAVLLAEAKAERTEAAELEGQALAGLRAITGDPEADIDDSELAAIAHDVPAKVSIDHRPQRLAAKAGAVAADELAAYESAQYFPDIGLVGSAVYSHADGVANPPSAFAWDPYRREGAGLGVGLQWTIEPWNVSARADRAKAEAHKSHAQAELAEIGATYDATTARADAIAAHERVAVTAEGEKAARTWLASVLQNQAIGTAESRDLVDAYLAWFTMRARWAKAVLDWNVDVVRLGRATGEYRAGAARPR
jgi:outer membrane protein TolC